MKKIFPVIVILITLSVVGIIIIQMSWINKSIQLKRDENTRKIYSSLRQIRKELQDDFIEKQNRKNNEVRTFGNEKSKENYLENNFTTDGIFTDEEIHQIIQKELSQNDLKSPFEFCITNYFGNPIHESNGFHVEYIKTSTEYLLSPENSLHSNENLYLYITENKSTLRDTLVWMIIGSVIFTLIIISAFAVTVRTLFNQKKLSEIKSDFINNMTHELKTPLATISLAIDALTNEKVIHNTDKIKYYGDMIKEENKRMNKQVEKILQAARIEQQDISLNLQPLDAHAIINKVADNLALQIQEKHGVLELQLKAEKRMIEADEVHFSNIIFNLLDNAIKYSKDNLRIQVETQSTNSVFVIKVKDNGIGMNKETQSRIFEKFYRAHTGNIHDVKGFGLGLTYVKAIVEAHDGKIKVDSALGKGSVFTVYLPLTHPAT